MTLFATVAQVIRLRRENIERVDLPSDERLPVRWALLAILAISATLWGVIFWAVG